MADAIATPWSLVKAHEADRPSPMERKAPGGTTVLQ